MKDYDSSGPSKFIMYLVMNNFYGASTSQCLPTGGFKWLNQKKIGKINLGTYTADSKKGLILEVDLQYPSNLHNLHNDYPLGAEKMKVTKDMLPPYCNNIQEIYCISMGKDITHQNYNDTLLNRKQMYHTMNII